MQNKVNYIHRETGEQKTHRQLCIEFNASIPVGMDYLDWTTIKYQPQPEVPQGSAAVLAGVEKIDGVWHYGWSVEPLKVEVPFEISILQALAQLDIDGGTPAVEAYFGADDTPRLEKLAWERATAVERQSPTTAIIADILEWDAARVDQFFIAAKKIKL